MDIRTYLHTQHNLAGQVQTARPCMASVHNACLPCLPMARTVQAICVRRRACMASIYEQKICESACQTGEFGMKCCPSPASCLAQWKAATKLENEGLHTQKAAYGRDHCLHHGSGEGQIAQLTWRCLQLQGKHPQQHLVSKRSPCCGSISCTSHAYKSTVLHRPGSCLPRSDRLLGGSAHRSAPWWRTS